MVHLKYDPSKASFEDLVRFFYTFHDPTTVNQQGNDRGTQYASAIFTHTEEQRATSLKVTAELQAALDSKKVEWVGRPYAQGRVTTNIQQATKFYSAEEYHQQYLDKNPTGYCNHGMRLAWPGLAKSEL